MNIVKIKSEALKHTENILKKIFSKEHAKQVIFGIAMNSFLVFVLFVVFVQANMDYRFGNYFEEIIKIFQFIVFTYLMVYFLKKKLGWLVALLGTLLCWFQLVLTLYFSFAKKRLDFAFFNRNKENILDVLAPYGMRLALIFTFSLIVGYFFYKFDLKLEIKKRAIIIFFFTLIVFSFPVFAGERYLNEVLFFIKSSYSKDAVVEKYQEKYDDLIAESIKNKKTVLKNKNVLEEKKIPAYLENIIILQLESINGRLINENNSPNYYEIAKEGVLYENFYGNSVQTILGQENILCSLPSSFNFDLVSSGFDKDVLCLPGLVNAMGYNTAFFKTYSLAFEDTGTFMENIGFNDLHDYDIMKSNDPRYLWGYREDVFYQRVFDYIRNNYTKRKNLIFVEVGPTNHWPFDTPLEYVGEVPFPEPKNHEEKLTNTTFLQDKHLEIAWNEIQKTFPNKNYTVIIIGDHSWPHEEHFGNEFCVSGSYEENFLTSMTIVFGDENHMNDLKGKVINEKFSQMDIFPSFSRLLGVDVQKNIFQKDLFAEKNSEKKILLIQPFLDKTLSVIENNDKFQYKIREKELVYFDLNKDPQENYEVPLRKGSAAAMMEVSKLLNIQ